MPLFRDDDQDYQDWFEAHPDAWIVNAPRSGKPVKSCLHHVTPTRSCAHITPPWPGRSYTQSKTKLCFASRDELVAWHAHDRRPLIYCQTCAPAPL
ncbi:MAG: hypothetical protein IT340_17165 [Chloroflexi bacterium]|nr:hypothetical protein [Chloroflexota bacterium]